MTEGVLVIFEGGEKVGKSTQVERLYQYLCGKYGSNRIVKTKEPGGGIPAIREEILALDPSLSNLADEELKLFMKDRKQHYQELILPALQAGEIVLCDRGPASALAYQGYARGIDWSKIGRENVLKKFKESPVLNKIRHANHEATQQRSADLTIFLDIDPKIAFARIRSAKQDNRFECEDEEFHRRVREGFIYEWLLNSWKWQMIKADADEGTIAQKIIDAVEKRLRL